jgi:DNA-binding response OmpR family regulator
MALESHRNWLGKSPPEQLRHMLRVNVSNLRRKIKPNPARPRNILTEPGVGYRLRTSV